jgi:hypothetical protein
MTPEEMAKAGVWLLKKAVADFLSTQPSRAARPDTIRDALCLHDETDPGNHRGRLLWGLQFLLQRDGLVRTEKIDGLNHMVLVASESRQQNASS